MQVQNALMAAHEDEGRHVAEAVAQGKGLWRFAGLGQGKRALEKRAHATPVGVDRIGTCSACTLRSYKTPCPPDKPNPLLFAFFSLERKHSYPQLVRHAASPLRLLSVWDSPFHMRRKDLSMSS